MPKVELTDRFCRKTKVAGRPKVDHFDTLSKGLCLRTTEQGLKTWFAVYSKPGSGKQRIWYKLGTYPDVTLADARQAAKDTRNDVGAGADPAAEKRSRAASQTVSDLVDNYVARHAASKRSGAEIARRLRKNVSDVIGGVKLSELHRRDLTKAIDAIVDRGARTEANRVFEDLRAMVRWARDRGDLDSNLAEGMRKPSETVKRDRVLTTEEIRTVWSAIDSADMWAATRRILRLCLVTGQRVGEVSGMTRNEIDLDAALWIIPAERAKNKRDHAVPLSGLGLEIVREQLAAVEALSERKSRAIPHFVFPGPGARAATTAASVAKAVKRAEIEEGTILGVAPWTPHDLRRTAATRMEALGISPFIIGHVLNHISITKASLTSQVYARYDYAKEKREALNLWADHLTATVTS